MTHEEFLSDIPLDVARAAHAGTSHVPERRGDQERDAYARQLAQDLETLSALADTDVKRAALAEEFPRYREGYRTRYVAMLAAKSRCMSTMIAGASKFPVARNARRVDAADARTTELIEYRSRAIAAIRKVLTPELQPIASGDADALERLEAKISEVEARQKRYKAANAAIRKHAKAGPEVQIAALVDLGFSPALAGELLKPDALGRVGFANYELTNSNANIRRMKERLAQLAEAKATPASEVAGEHARLEDNPADNRVRLYYPGKPPTEVRERLKRAGFRWAPSLGCWQAYRNHNSLATARREVGVTEMASADPRMERSSSVVLVDG
ncbi:MAG: hypothetical protein ACTHU0_10025 [Kofleriaceae bacterium]